MIGRILDFKAVRFYSFVCKINRIQVKTTMHTPNCDEDHNVEENYDDDKTLENDEEKKTRNEHSGETTSRETEVQNI